MQQLVFIHGATAFSKYEDFLSWLRTVPVDDPANERPRMWPATLREELADTHEVIAPSMPNKQNAKYEEWKIWFERHIPFFRDNVVLAGWSQGGYFLAKYLVENTLPVSVSGLYLIATPFEPDDFSGEDGGDFHFDTTQVGALAHRADAIYLFHSRDDGIVPFRHAERYRAALPGADLVAFDDRGHFLGGEFPELVEHLRSHQLSPSDVKAGGEAAAA